LVGLFLVLSCALRFLLGEISIESLILECSHCSSIFIIEVVVVIVVVAWRHLLTATLVGGRHVFV